MKAVFLEQPGPPEVIQYGELRDPEPGEGQVLVRVEAVTVNPIDLYIRAGTIPLPLPRPYIVGRDMAGTVVKNGPGARRFKPGDRVWCVNQGKITDQGLSAELVTPHENWLLPIPDGVDAKDAAALALVGTTAHLGLFLKAGLNKGETLFTHGGSGGVGSAVVQMGKAAGARVLTSAGSREKAEKCRDFGADGVLLYKEENTGEALKSMAPDGIDVWYETLREPDFETIIPLMKIRGRIVVMAGRQSKVPLPVGPFYNRDLKIFGLALFNASADELRSAGEEMNRWMADGALRGNIDRVLPLAQAAEAHRLLDESTLQAKGTIAGKIVLTV